MPGRISYVVTLEIPGEPREAPHPFANLDSAIAAAVAYARRNRGVRASVQVIVPQSKLHTHVYDIFQCESPDLEPFMREGIRRHYHVDQLPF